MPENGPTADIFANDTTMGWHRSTFREYSKPIILLLILWVLVVIIGMPFIFLVRPDLFVIPVVLGGFGVAFLFTMVPVIAGWIIWYAFIQQWARRLPNKVHFDDVLDAIERIEPTMQDDTKWTDRLRVAPNSEHRLLVLVPSNSKARLYLELASSNLLLIVMKRRVSDAERQLLIDFVDNAISLAGKEAIARGEGQKS